MPFPGASSRAGFVSNFQMSEAELKRHGWKAGQACYLYITSLGHVGDCSGGVELIPLITMILSAAILLTLWLILAVRGKTYLLKNLPKIPSSLLTLKKTIPPL